MSHIHGEHDADLHHADGTHRDAPPPVPDTYSDARPGGYVSGAAVAAREEGWADWEDRLKRHLERHEQEAHS